VLSNIRNLSPEKLPEKSNNEKPTTEHLLRVGVFDGNGAGAVSVIETIEALKIDKGIEPYPISAADIINGELSQTDVLFFPGGSGSKQIEQFGDE